jgi:DNA-binding response OmpR family regulator
MKSCAYSDLTTRADRQIRRRAGIPSSRPCPTLTCPFADAFDFRVCLGGPSAGSFAVELLLECPIDGREGAEEFAMRLLVVEDNAELVPMLGRLLESGGFAMDHAGTVEDAMLMLRTSDYAAVVLDLGLPDGSGLAVVQAMRLNDDTTPVIALTARGAVADRVSGLAAGADDYLVKPFAPAELLARIQALLRRTGTIVDRMIQCGNVQFDPGTREVEIAQVPTMLSARELELLDVLIRRHGRVVPKATVEAQMFGIDDDLGSNAVEVYVHRLRKRLAGAGASAEIVTVRGIGYMLGVRGG